MKKIILLISTIIIGLSATAQKNLYNFTVKSQDGQKEVYLSDYKGKYVLIVNTATQCGFTPQYTELEEIYNEYKDRGFVILDFPCNQFGEQAPGSDIEIHNFCTSQYNITFPQFAKVYVNGRSADPLFVWLKSQKGFEGFDLDNPIGKKLHQAFLKADPNYAQSPDIKWNFTKFLIDDKGNVVARFEPTADMRKVREAIESLISKK